MAVQITVKEQLEALDRVSKKILRSRESALKFLIDAGIIKESEVIPPKGKRASRKKK